MVTERQNNTPKNTILIPNRTGHYDFRQINQKYTRDSFYRKETNTTHEEISLAQNKQKRKHRKITGRNQLNYRKNVIFRNVAPYYLYWNIQHQSPTENYGTNCWKKKNRMYRKLSNNYKEIHTTERKRRAP